MLDLPKKIGFYSFTVGNTVHQDLFKVGIGY